METLNGDTLLCIIRTDTNYDFLGKLCCVSRKLQALVESVLPQIACDDGEIVAGEARFYRISTGILVNWYTRDHSGALLPSDYHMPGSELYGGVRVFGGTRDFMMALITPAMLAKIYRALVQ